LLRLVDGVGRAQCDTVEDFFLNFDQFSVPIAPGSQFHPGDYSSYLMGDRQCGEAGDLHRQTGDIDAHFIFLQGHISPTPIIGFLVYHIHYMSSLVQ
jgi:hypothetical protein